MLCAYTLRASDERMKPEAESKAEAMVLKRAISYSKAQWKRPMPQTHTVTKTWTWEWCTGTLSQNTPVKVRKWIRKKSAQKDTQMPSPVNRMVNQSALRAIERSNGEVFMHSPTCRTDWAICAIDCESSIILFVHGMMVTCFSALGPSYKIKRNNYFAHTKWMKFLQLYYAQ